MSEHETTAEASILHVDMDAFFASVELLRHPELRGQPVIVGGSGSRGVVAAASYEARAYGVHSAMPGVRAKRLCPQATFLDGDHAHYSEVSHRIMEICRSFTPLVEPLSLDEAFLDVSGVRRLFGSPVTIAHELRRRILEHEGLHASVGVARVKFLAKIATGWAKPKASPQGPRPGPGVFEVGVGDEAAFLRALPVQSLWGVGPVTHERLARLGVRTVGDLAQVPETALVASLGSASGAHLHALAQGRDPRPVVADHAPKSISHEETFGRDRHRHDELEVELVRLADAVGARLRAASLAGRTVTLKVRFGDFSTVTRSSTVASGVDSGHELSAIGVRLLGSIDVASGVRLIGLAVSQLDGERPRQLSLDDLLSEEAGEAAAWPDAEKAMDAVRARFGASSLGPASLSGPDGLRVARRGDQPWGPGDDPG